MLGMVFAAGLGTRLRPLTDRLPKPVVPLLNRPLAAFSLERLRAAGVRYAVLNTHHLGPEVPRALAGHVPEGLEALFVHEPTLLGTGGGLRNGLRALVERAGPDETFLVMNGDILFWPDLEGAIALHRRLDAVATVILRPDPRAKALGALGVDDAGRVRTLLGQPAWSGAALEELMFTGVHVLSARALDDLPEEGCVIRRSYRRWVDHGEVVGGFVDHGAWRDLGTPAEYHQAHMDLLRGQSRWPSFAPPGDGIVSAPGVSVGEGARLREVVLGAGARIEPGVTLERAVVWPGAVVSADTRDAIVTPDATVSVA